MRFTINLVTRTYLDDRLVSRWCKVVFLILISALAYTSYRTVNSAGELQRLSDEISVLEARFAKRPQGVSEKDFSQLTSRIGFYNGIIRKKGYDWLSLLDKLEQVTPEGVSLSLLQPDQKEQILKIEGRAKSFKLVQTYVEKLNDSMFFTSVLLLSHETEKNGESSQGVSFVVTCKAVLP